MVIFYAMACNESYQGKALLPNLNFKRDAADFCINLLIPKSVTPGVWKETSQECHEETSHET